MKKNKMQEMADAENELAAAIEALLPELQKKYPGANIEKNTASIKCYHNNNGSYRHICIVPDYSLRTPPDLTQFKGMTIKWHDALKSVNPGAWKVQVKGYSNGEYYEVSPTCREIRWLQSDFERVIRESFL